LHAACLLSDVQTGTWAPCHRGIDNGSHVYSGFRERDDGLWALSLFTRYSCNNFVCPKFLIPCTLLDRTACRMRPWDCGSSVRAGGPGPEHAMQQQICSSSRPVAFLQCNMCLVLARAKFSRQRSPLLLRTSTEPIPFTRMEPKPSTDDHLNRFPLSASVLKKKESRVHSTKRSSERPRSRGLPIFFILFLF
jgi:hypothetical protein